MTEGYKNYFGKLQYKQHQSNNQTERSTERATLYRIDWF